MTNPIKVTPGQARRLQRNVERAGEGRKAKRKVKPMNDAFVDELKAKIELLNEEQINALWRWITMEFVNKVNKRRKVK